MTPQAPSRTRQFIARPINLQPPGHRPDLHALGFHHQFPLPTPRLLEMFCSPTIAPPDCRCTRSTSHTSAFPQVCFQYYGQWSTALATPLTVAAPLYISAPSTATIGLSENATLVLAGTAFDARWVYQAAIVPQTQTCTALSIAALPTPTEVASGSSSATFDLSEVEPGAYRLCLTAVGQNTTTTLSTDLTVVSLAVESPGLLPAPGQRLTFTGAVLRSQRGRVALVSAGYTCQNAEQMHIELDVVDGEEVCVLVFVPPALQRMPCPTNTSVRTAFPLGPDELGTGFGYRIN